MKRSLLISIIVCLSASLASAASASSNRSRLQQELDSIGDNDAIVEKARAQDPHNKVEIVQNRLVDPTGRLELGVNYSLEAGGEAYFQTQDLGGLLDYHIDPHWSLGARYYHSFNTLTSEGQAIFNNAQSRAHSAQGDYLVPAFNYPVDTYLGTVSWYPIYGKLALFTSSVVHFDFYTLAGAGDTILDTANSFTFTVGGGWAVWLSQHLSMRLEGRYQNYNSPYSYNGTTPIDGSQTINEAIFMASIGLLL